MKRRFLLGWIFVILALMLTGCGAIAQAQGELATANVTVQVTLMDFQISASIVKFAVGVPYHFVIANKSDRVHEQFQLGPLIEPGMTMRDVEQQKLFGFKSIAPGETKFADYTFTKAAPLGTWQFSCHVGTLYEPRMRLGIVVIDPQSNTNNA
ncbi:MAG TPA: hypothetical protein VFB60_27955 [Ktedonobacteraceae bacterium]|nr:hypothetical protein [Ktedonobacteraceae bacterium]